MNFLVPGAVFPSCIFAAPEKEIVEHFFWKLLRVSAANTYAACLWAGVDTVFESFVVRS